MPRVDLKLLVEAPFAAAIIGKGGHAVRRLRGESGVESIHLSHNAPGVRDRVVCVAGEKEAVCTAYALITALLRTEAGLSPAAPTRVRLLVPTADSLIGPKALRRLRQASGAEIEVAPAPPGSGSAKETLVTCTGTTEQTERSAAHLTERHLDRQLARHREFLAQWNFSTSYSDHFETPSSAYEHILPLLRVAAERRRQRERRPRKRKRDDAADVADTADAADAADGGASAGASGGADALQELTVYDPYFCQGAVRDALAALGLCRDRVLNANRDFYADVAQGSWPAHDVLVTNPPFSADHKQRLLDFLLARQRPRGAPFLLLLPAWLAATDYWADFVAKLADVRGRPRAGRTAERRAGVFYLSPCERYGFRHPEATGHAVSPFHAVWFVGGWPTKAARRAALAALRPLRTQRVVEVFRSSAMLQKRCHFTPASAAKQV